MNIIRRPEGSYDAYVTESEATLLFINNQQNGLSMPEHLSLSRRQCILSGGIISSIALSGCTEGLLDSAPAEDEIRREAETVPYEELYRNISEYEGSYVHYEAQISSVDSNEGTKEYVIILPSESFTTDEIIWGVWEGDPFRRRDSVEFWGEVRGMTEYTSLTGERAVPEIQIYYMERL